jgi:class 3 adenylate cyclase
VIEATEGIGVRDLTLLFTDLKGSTELYDRIGDLNAYSQVQCHFERLLDVTVRHNGAVVKTIGDAIMAAFVTPPDAVSAALKMRSEIERLNEARAARDRLLRPDRQHRLAGRTPRRSRRDLPHRGGVCRARGR